MRQRVIAYVEFEVFTAVVNKARIFTDIKPCRPLKYVAFIFRVEEETRLRQVASRVNLNHWTSG
jgi:hypothetical protein